MKKILALILAMAMMLSLVACSNSGKKEETSADTEVETTVEGNEEETVKEETEDKKTEDKKEEDKKTEDKKDNKDDKKPADKPVDKPADKPADKPVDKPADKPEEKPVEKPADTTPKTAGNQLLADFKSKAGSYSNALSLAEAISQNSIIPFMAGAMAVEPGYLSGFDAEITGFKEAAAFMPMIGSIPFIGYVFILEDGADVSSFISNLKANANLRWNICVEAEEMVTGSVGNKVFFVMSNKSFEE
ncbi:MAG: hypothetical protein J6A69_02130 [Clostridia bacterium]|nr:hypothetical protein [Clostridia bacterium]